MKNPLSRQSYGKSRVRMTRVIRGDARHELIELSVDVELEGEFEATYESGDNRLVVATDSMKNTVYVLASRHGVADIESFGAILVAHFTEQYAHVTRATARLSEVPWERIDVDGSPHPHAFVGTARVRHTATVSHDREKTHVVSGIDDLVVLKTTGSAFREFLRDEFTTLADADDRLFGTSITAEWTYRRSDADGPTCRGAVRRALLETFATHESLSVQHTLRAMGDAALESCSAIDAITLSMPNQHRLPVDLGPFGLENPNEIFVPTDEPFGMIRATITRGGVA